MRAGDTLPCTVSACLWQRIELRSCSHSSFARQEKNSLSTALFNAISHSAGKFFRKRQTHGEWQRRGAAVAPRWAHAGVPVPVLRRRAQTQPRSTGQRSRAGRCCHPELAAVRCTGGRRCWCCTCKVKAINNKCCK